MLHFIKNTTQYLTLCPFIFFSLFSYKIIAQDGVKTPKDTKGLFSQIGKPISEYSILRPSGELISISRKVSTKPNYVSSPALNIFFHDQIATYLSSSKDLAVDKYYTFLDQEDKRLFIGGSWGNVEKERYSPFLFQTGLKLDVDDGFASVFAEEDGFANNIGGSIKFTYLRPGSIVFGCDNCKTKFTKDIEAYENHQDALFTAEYKDELVEMQKEIEDYARENEMKLATETDTTDIEKLLGVSREKLLKEYRKKHMTKVAEYLKKQKPYSYMRKMWYSVDLYVPFSNRTSNVTESFQSLGFDTVSVYPIELTLSYTFLMARKNESRLFVTPFYSLAYQNNILTKDLKKTSFKTFLERDTANSDLDFTETKSQDLYVGEVKNFFTHDIGINFVYMFGGKMTWLGVSPRYEVMFRNPGENATHFFKLGLPIATKDKKGDVAVNFEPQVRWDSSDKSFLAGISVGVPFGKPIYK